jgi:S1-C subfamily serine protease
MVSTNSGHGTGFPITAHCVVTAEHVVDGDEDSVRIAGSDKVDHQATVLRADKEIDVAVVCAADINMVPVRMASSMPEQYASVYAIGNPLTFEHVLTEGVYQGGHYDYCADCSGKFGRPSVQHGRGRYRIG